MLHCCARRGNVCFHCCTDLSSYYGILVCHNIYIYIYIYIYVCVCVCVCVCVVNSLVYRVYELGYINHCCDYSVGWLTGNVQTCFGAHRTFFPEGTGIISLGVMESMTEVNRSPAYSAAVKKYFISL
jgi:hypothetical protein